jgi:hypothetical protein
MYQYIFEQHVQGPAHVAVRVYVNAAFLRAFEFPPPTPGALELAFLDRSGAKNTADAAIAAFGQRMAQNAVAHKIGLNLRGSPVGQKT